MKAIRINNGKEEEYEMPVKDSLIVTAQILEGYDGHEEIKGLKSLIDEVKHYIYEEAKRLSDEE